MLRITVIREQWNRRATERERKVIAREEARLCAAIEHEVARRHTAGIRAAANMLTALAVAMLAYGWYSEVQPLMIAGAIVLSVRVSFALARDLASLIAAMVLSTIIAIFAPMFLGLALLIVVPLAIIFGGED